MTRSIFRARRFDSPSVRTDARPARRRVLGFALAMVVAVAATGAPAMAAKAAKPAKQKKLPDTMLPLKITQVVVRDGQLVALGTLGDTTFESPITVTRAADPAPNGCPILHLALGPINLNFLGLNVETSPICLDVIANPGPGNLLGNLLCGVAGLLDPNGLNLGNVLGGLNAADLQGLLDGITGLLNGALAQVTAPNAATAVGGTQAGATDILNLSLGPVDLNLLGLEVALDDCNDGPVTVDVTAVPGPGNLLGNLLGNLAGLLDGPANGNAIANALNRVADAILQLVG